MIDDFQKLQHAIAGFLSGVPGFENLAIFVMRPRVLPDGTAVDAPGIQGAVQSALAGLVSGSDLPGNITITPKAGAAAQVLMPRIDVYENNAAQPQEKVRIVVRFVENLLVNCATDGTQVSAEQFAMLAKDALHHWCPAAPWKMEMEEGGTIEPISDGDSSNLIIYELNLFTYSEGRAVEHVDAPRISVADGLATLSCDTPGAAIYYTIDGTFPFARNSRAVLYSAPFTIRHGRLETEDGDAIVTESGDQITTEDFSSTDPGFITVCAFKSGLAPSDVVERDFTL